MYVCLCKAVTDRRIDAVIADGASTVEEIQAETGAGTKCKGCVCLLKKRLQAAQNEAACAPEMVGAGAESGGMSTATGTYRFGRPASIAASPA